MNHVTSEHIRLRPPIKLRVLSYIFFNCVYSLIPLENSLAKEEFSISTRTKYTKTITDCSRNGVIEQKHVRRVRIIKTENILSLLLCSQQLGIRTVSRRAPESHRFSTSTLITFHKTTIIIFYVVFSLCCFSPTLKNRVMEADTFLHTRRGEIISSFLMRNNWNDLHQSFC